MDVIVKEESNTECERRFVESRLLPAVEGSLIAKLAAACGDTSVSYLFRDGGGIKYRVSCDSNDAGFDGKICTRPSVNPPGVVMWALDNSERPVVVDGRRVESHVADFESIPAAIDDFLRRVPGFPEHSTAHAERVRSRNRSGGKTRGE